MMAKTSSLNTIIRVGLGVAFVGIVIVAVTSDAGQVLRSYKDESPLVFLAVAFLSLLLTQIVAPISGFSIYLVIVAVFGLEIAFITLTASYLSSSLVNFYIARSFGQGVLIKLLGNKAVDRVRYIDARSSLGYVVLSRIAGYYLHDVLSYLWGLTKIDARHYFFGTLIGTLIATFSQYLVFRLIDTSDRTHLILFYVGLLAVSAASYFAWRAIFERDR